MINCLKDVYLENGRYIFTVPFTDLTTISTKNYSKIIAYYPFKMLDPDKSTAVWLQAQYIYSLSQPQLFKKN